MKVAVFRELITKIRDFIKNTMLTNNTVYLQLETFQVRHVSDVVSGISSLGIFS